MSRRATSGVVDRDKGISMVEPCRKTEEKSNDDFHGGGNNVLVDGFDERYLRSCWLLDFGFGVFVVGMFDRFVLRALWSMTFASKQKVKFSDFVSIEF